MLLGLLVLLLYLYLVIFVLYLLSQGTARAIGECSIFQKTFWRKGLITLLVFMIKILFYSKSQESTLMCSYGTAYSDLENKYYFFSFFRRIFLNKY